MRLSVVIPFYNEEASVRPLFARLWPVLEGLAAEIEIICIDDGSHDATSRRLLAQRATDARVHVIALSRNFGKEAALTAGLDHATGDAIVFMDGDLQHPPELIADFLAKMEDGWDVVYGVKRSRQGENPLYAAFSRLFYSGFSKAADIPLPRDAGDFRIISKRVADALRQMRERQRFMKGLFAWVGFKQTGIEFHAEPRRHGRTSWSLASLTGLAWDGIVSFSSLPLRFWSFLGLLIATASGAYAAYIVIDTMLHGNPLPGYPTIVTAIFFLGGVQLLSVGIVGEYVARIFTEAKQRPLYLVQDKYMTRRQMRTEGARGEVVHLDLHN